MRVIPVSGGYDSTYLLHYLLSCGGDSCAAHHVYLINSENKRYVPESIVFRSVIKEMKKMHGDFLCTTSVHKQFQSCWYGWDLLTAAYHSAVAAEGHIFLLGPIDLELCLPISKEAYRMDDRHSSLVDRVEAMWRAYFSTFGIRATVSYPISNMTKGEIIEGLPPNLRQLCWTCRNPVNFLYPCGECRSCLAAGV